LKIYLKIIYFLIFPPKKTFLFGLGVGLGFGFFGFLGFGCWVGFWVFWIFWVWVLGWVKNQKPNPKTQFFLGAGDWLKAHLLKSFYFHVSKIKILSRNILNKFLRN
jgi:hypothetical protein